MRRHWIIFNGNEAKICWGLVIANCTWLDFYQVTHLLCASFSLPAEWAQRHCPCQELMRNIGCILEPMERMSGNTHVDAVSMVWPHPAVCIPTATLSRDLPFAYSLRQTYVSVFKLVIFLLLKWLRAFLLLLSSDVLLGRECQGTTVWQWSGGLSYIPPPLFYRCKEQSIGMVLIIDTAALICYILYDRRKYAGIT